MYTRTLVGIHLSSDSVGFHHLPHLTTNPDSSALQWMVVSAPSYSAALVVFSKTSTLRVCTSGFLGSSTLLSMTSGICGALFFVIVMELKETTCPRKNMSVFFSIYFSCFLFHVLIFSPVFGLLRRHSRVVLSTLLLWRSSTKLHVQGRICLFCFTSTSVVFSSMSLFSPLLGLLRHVIRELFYLVSCCEGAQRKCMSKKEYVCSVFPLLLLFSLLCHNIFTPVWPLKTYHSRELFLSTLCYIYKSVKLKVVNLFLTFIFIFNPHDWRRRFFQGPAKEDHLPHRQQRPADGEHIPASAVPAHQLRHSSHSPDTGPGLWREGTASLFGHDILH